MLAEGRKVDYLEITMGARAPFGEPLLTTGFRNFYSGEKKKRALSSKNRARREVFSGYSRRYHSVTPEKLSMRRGSKGERPSIPEGYTGNRGGSTRQRRGGGKGTLSFWKKKEDFVRGKGHRTRLGEKREGVLLQGRKRGPGHELAPGERKKPAYLIL